MRIQISGASGIVDSIDDDDAEMSEYRNPVFVEFDLESEDAIHLFTHAILDNKPYGISIEIKASEFKQIAKLL